MHSEFIDSIEHENSDATPEHMTLNDNVFNENTW